jgi:predicted MFS family arabinose efflux permease
VCAAASDLFWITIGRAIQGAGAISAALTAWLADATREAVRTRAMAMVGASIGLSFALSLLLSPLLVGWWGLSGLFWTIASLGVLSLAVARWGVPIAPPVHAYETPTAGLVAILRHRELLGLNFGVFVLHGIQISLFLVVPTLLVQLGGLAPGQLWLVYLPVILLSFILMVPIIFFVEKYRVYRGVLHAMVLTLIIVCTALPWASQGFYPLAAALCGFFLAFNVLEALQPALVSRIAPPCYKGLALGFYNTAQAMGLLAGGTLGGWLAANAGASAVFFAAAGLSILWLVFTWTEKPLANIALR